MPNTPLPSLLGKRKRASLHHKLDAQPRTASPSSSNSLSDQDDGVADLQDIFKRHFEAQFKPLDDLPPSGKTKDIALGDGSAEDDDGSDWQGFEDEGTDEGEQAVQVVEHTSLHRPERLSKAEAKAYMSSKPPPSDPKPAQKASKAAQFSEDGDQADKLNLKNDLALQRLITESHLLDPAKANSSGGQRQKILDMRLKSLGSKSSILEQEKMPMSHRKGIVAKAKDRETRRRQEAKENGIILEKATKVKKSEDKRVRGVTGPSVGKFKGGTLRLSKRDVADITGPKKFKRR